MSVYESIYIEGLPLQLTGIVLGALLIGLHLYALFRAAPVKDFLAKVPRHRTIGVVVLTIDLIWSLWLISTMDMGEFYTAKPWLQTLIPLTYVLVILFVDEFLAVRAIGAFLLLLACPVLEAAFLNGPDTRILIPILGYVWILVGMFWVGMPYLMRNQIEYVTKTDSRWTAACAAGATYGALMLVCALLFWAES